MAIEKMKMVMVSSPPEHVMAMISEIKDYTLFHPELSTDVVSEDDGGKPYNQELLYDNFENRLKKITEISDATINEVFTKEFTVDEIESKIAEAEKMCERELDLKNAARDLSVDDLAALEALKDYPIRDLDKGFIVVSFGKMPQSSLEKITAYYDEHFLYTILHRNKKHVWILYLCLRREQQKFSDIFESLSFEMMDVLKAVRNKPNYDYCENLKEIAGYVKHMRQCEEYYRYVTVYNEKVTMTGFVAEKDLEEFKQKFDEAIHVHVFPPDIHPHLIAPTRLRNNAFARPFEMFVQMYGLPKYGEYDPTFVFAITYSVLFGMMFGDLGQGFVIMICGLLATHIKKMKLGAILTRIGFFSMIFGTIYGSFFGDESILEPILEPLGLPIHVSSDAFTMNLLIIAVVLGIALISMSILTNVVVSARRKRYERAFLNANGLAGLVFYLFVIVGLGLKVVGINIINPITIGLFIALPLLLLFLKEPIVRLIEGESFRPEEGWGSYAVESFFELFEVLLGFVSNTLSFMRVGGFVLSHAGMMTVVMTLRGMSGSMSPLVLIVGNLLVIGLEGLIVGIQTLRLQYYELFSRYYDGGGKPFRAVN